MKKKLFSLMLALVMVLGMVPLGGLALAADGSPVFAVTAPANKTIEATAAYAVDQNPHNVVIGREIELKHGKIGILWTRGGGTEDVEWFTPEDVPVQGVTRQCHVDDWIYVMFRAEKGYVIKGKYIYAYSEELDGGRRLLNDDWGDRYEGDIVVPSDIEDFDFYITIDAAFKPETGKREIVVGSREPLSHGKVIIKSNTGTPLAEFTQKGDCLANEGASYRVSFIADEGYELDEKEIVFYSFDDGEDTEADLIYDSETDCYTFTVPTDRTDDYEIAINASFRKIPTHSVTVHGGTADKASAAEGESVTITADEPEEGMRFKEWTGADGLSFTSGGPTDAEATFTMPAQAVAVTATYEPAAVIEYDLWLGEKRVTSLNQGDILDDGTASFDPETNTLTFTVEQPAITGLYQTFKIYAFNMDLVINSPGKLILNKNSTRGNCIAAYNHDLTVNGDVDLTAENSCIAAKNITVNGSVTATGGKIVNADPGSVKIDGDAKLTSTDYGIWANTDITVTGSVDASAKTGAVYAYGNVTIGGSLNAADAVNNSKLTSVYAGGDLSVGGDVTVKNKENYDYGIVSMTGKITVGSGRWEAEGFRGAMWAKKGIIIPQTHLIHVPENGSVGEADLSGVNGYSVLNKDGETAKRAVIERVVEYPLWLGETRVTSANKGDILGDQSASFDPETNTLTFTKSDPAITGLYQFPGYAFGFMITSDRINLTINAPNGLTLNSEAGGIFCRYGGLTVNGNLTVSAKKQTLNANYITVNGDLDASASFTQNVYCKGDLKVSGDVKAGCESGCGIIVYGKLRVGSGRWEIEGNDIAVFATNGIVIPDTHIVTTPENGQVGEAEYHYNITTQGLSILDSEGAVAKKVVIEPIPVTYYPLWLGETQVSSANAGDILGDQTASFDPETNNLAFTVETPAIVGTHEDALIYADGINLTINAAEKLTLVNNEIEYGDCVVVLSGDLTINGDVDVTADYYGLRGSNVTVNGDLKAVGNQAVRAQTGSVYIDGGADVTGGEYGIYANENITVTGDVKAEGEKAVYAYDGSVSIGGDANITGVERGIYAFENVTVTGDIVAQAPGCAVSAERGNLVVGGSLTATEGTSDAETERYTCAVFGYVDVVVGGSLTVKTKWAYGVYGQNAVTVGPGKWDIESGTAAICRGEEIIIPETHGFTLPEGGKIVKDDYCGDYYTSNEDGSYAAHVIIERVRNIKGDLTGEGLVDNRDLILLARYLVHLEELDEMQLAAADFNEDGTVNNSDLVQIARYIVSEQG